ncbi:hypothetical protein [Marinobacterium sedimentorum]|uniref:hypothetical protein n=1 Tax=Marinobacterium sedimentorum TaxID=2927804 RepID=UPI0020C62F68|nr:hypothetical protein [Marinobacterium sedimentorum]MCP8689373.1 hypothetical protein [Marinobacterium sedimentorum]
MGLINFGVPEKEVCYLEKTLNLNVFVEGGTYLGGTAKIMSSSFKTVYTIEKSEEMFKKAEKNLSSFSNVIMLKGDTREHLHSILEQNDNILFWLDAHWSGGLTYGKYDECPLIDELEIIFTYNKNYIVMIDDARLFLAPPPCPHDFMEWKTLVDIVKSMPEGWDLIVYEDVIYLFPDKISAEFKAFLQKKITDKARKKRFFLSKSMFGKIGYINRICKFIKLKN